jgi:hypothetical protein
MLKMPTINSINVRILMKHNTFGNNFDPKIDGFSTRKPILAISSSVIPFDRHFSKIALMLESI